MVQQKSMCKIVCINKTSECFSKKGENLKIDQNAILCITKKNIPQFVLLKLFTNMTVTSDRSVWFEWVLVQNNHQSILYKKRQKFRLIWAH